MVASGQQRVGVKDDKIAALETATNHLRDLDRQRKEQNKVHSKINKIHTKLSQTGISKAEKYGEKLWVKLRGLYMQAKALAEQEETTSCNCIKALDLYLAPAQGPSNRKKPDASEQKRKRVKQDVESARLTSPSVPPRTQVDYSAISLGDQVAARVSDDDAEKDDWIVVKVTRYERETNKFEVIDEDPGDDEDSGHPRKYKLPASCVIPFPKRTDPSSAPDFPVSSQVLAVYPGATALYRAVVVSPARKRKSDDYLLQFDDDEEEGELPKRPVVFYYVVHLPEGHRQ
eukprot:TRINITY_DN12445_c0_g1_i1.p1 TRINITY_DN12445_c0_g1~~TRINITY_DN12445_c0_g1_i1.p1  ORF type:complete len:287 (-),score=53.21 TRINITY_DN12445_c0_g1_i1:13-873(-)